MTDSELRDLCHRLFDAIEGKMRFRNRRVHVFEGGFVQQHTLHITRENDFEGQMDVCFIGYVRDGRLSRIYEYFDTGQIDKFLGPPGPDG